MTSSRMSTPLGMLLLFYICLSVPGLVSSQSTACDSGWFGTGCMYKCQCLGNTCPVNDQCSSCQTGYYGPACQYVDISQVSMLPSVQPSLTDNNDATCLPANSNLVSLDVTWNTAYPFTWMRITFQNPNSVNMINAFAVTFNSTQVPCSNLRIAAVNNQTLDIHCEQIGLVSQVTLMGSGVSSLCSIYVSGGRDVALRQNTTQSSTYATYGSDKAVDGNTDPQFSITNTCTATNLETNPSWSVRFSIPEAVNRYVLYNRDTNPERLVNFNFTSLNSANAVVYNYMDASTTPLSVYTIVTTTATVSTVTIQLSGTNKLLTICEFEIYGDSACAVGMYGRNCEKMCNCANNNDPCFVSTGGCPSGCAPGYLGESCTQICNPGKYGAQCGLSCSQNCMGSGTACSNIDGTCLQGCKTGYKPPTCQELNAGNSYKSSFGAIVRAVVGAVATLVIAMKF
uniref:Fucolectin tachylectin-4 pentraxin-1 domain-containing protein n=1 Tax=Arion vulgaris TaxID=1028688 RepID=A0A0B7B5B8_9EUPU